MAAQLYANIEKASDKANKYTHKAVLKTFFLVFSESTKLFEAYLNRLFVDFFKWHPCSAIYVLAVPSDYFQG